jgi:hypothetical protein
MQITWEEGTNFKRSLPLSEERKEGRKKGRREGEREREERREGGRGKE